MHKSQRIKIDPSVENIDDRHIKFNLEENVDTLEFLTLNFSLKDAYQAFNADYGVLVGRVIANDGIGVPNAKISVFIPLDEEDESNHEIYRIYPYKTPRDLNNERKRYNLLPRVANFNKEMLSYRPKQPFGSFPTKEEVLTNDNVREVYKKYYKHTATTNNNGDYMIFGVPVGLQTVHLSMDITDIGKYSMSPAAMVTNLGYSPNLFIDNIKIKSSEDLNDLPHIETQEISVDVIPFWGDIENYEIGITQQDFRIRAQLMNTFTIFGSAFTDAVDFMWGYDTSSADQEIQKLYRARQSTQVGLSMNARRIGKVTEKIYYYPAEISDIDIDNGNVDENGEDMFVLDSSEYSVYKRDGDFVFIVNCNRRKIITDEFGNEQVVSDDDPRGIFTEFRGFATIEITENEIPMDLRDHIGPYPITPLRYKLKIPQYAERDEGFSYNAPVGWQSNTTTWRKQHKTFKAGNIYSVAKFHGTVSGRDITTDGGSNLENGFMRDDIINKPYNEDPFWNTGIIAGDIIDFDNNNNPTGTTTELINNSVTDENLNVFGANWLNLCLHLPQVGYLNPTVLSVTLKSTKSTTSFTRNFYGPFFSSLNYYWGNNIQPVAANVFDMKWHARSDLHWTDFVEIPKVDIIAMSNYEGKGFTNENITISGTTYRNGIYENLDWTVTDACPLSGGTINGDPSAGSDGKTYFYKGFGDSNCIDFLISLGLT